MFFINFHVQQMLFINTLPFKLKDGFTNLLYCPIIREKTSNALQNINKNHESSNNLSEQSLKISDWYIHTINNIDPLWSNKFLLIKVIIYLILIGLSPFYMPYSSSVLFAFVIQ
jgi:hypothetical protein